MGHATTGRTFASAPAIVLLRKLLTRSFMYLGISLVAKLMITRYVVFGAWDPVVFMLGEIPFVLLVTGLLDAHREPTIRRILITDGFWSALLAIVLIFHSQFGKVPSVLALGWAAQLGGVGDSVIALLRWEYLLFFIDLPLFWLVYKAYPSFIEPVFKATSRRVVLWIAIGGTVANVVAGLVVPAPDTTIAAGRRGIVNAEILDVIGGMYETQIRMNTDDPSAVNSAVAEIIGEPGQIDPILEPGIAKDRNVIIILAESMQSMIVGLEIDGVSVTPNIDALAEDGIYFPNTYSQVAAGNTSDCEFVYHTSIYPSGADPTSERYGDRLVPSMPRALAAQGYSTHTFHANEGTFWNRDELYPALGYENVYAEEFFQGGDVVGLGASDQTLYEKAAPVLAEMNDSGEPFMATFVTLSAHHPFVLPESKVALDLPDRYDSTLMGNYLESMHYADKALGEFFDELKASGVYEDSMIVVIGDHFGLQQSQMSETDLLLAEEILGRPYNEADRLNVPLVMAVPGATEGIVHERPTGQVDIAPTVYALLGMESDEAVAFGRDATSTEPGLLGFRYYAPIGTFVDDAVVAIPRTDGGFDVYDARTQAPVSDPPGDVPATSEQVVDVQMLSDTYLDTLPLR